MKKIVLDYDESTGDIRDKTGAYIGTFMNIESYDLSSVYSNEKIVDDLIRLRNAGFDAEEIVDFKKNGLIV